MADGDKSMVGMREMQSPQSPPRAEVSRVRWSPASMAPKVRLSPTFPEIFDFSLKPLNFLPHGESEFRPREPGRLYDGRCDKEACPRGEQMRLQ